MKIKRAIRYLRISTDRQSNFSIDGQGMQTEQWCERNNVEIIDTKDTAREILTARI